MRKFTEEELSKIANNVYEEMKSESNVDESNFGTAVADVALNAIVKFVQKLQETE